MFCTGRMTGFAPLPKRLARGGGQLEHPRAGLGLVTGVEGFVVGLAGLPHFPEDLQPALAEAAERTGVTHAVFPLVLVVGIRPNALGATEVGPEVDPARRYLLQARR